MYRILAQNNTNRERRNQLTRPNYRKPELLATGPNQVWSWDITKLKGPETWTYYYLYVILDIFSRYTVGWMLAHREQADLAKKLIEETIEKQNVERDQLIIHSDRGPSMTSHSVANLLGSLGVTKSLSRPHVSNDNPYSESQFKTMKYQPEFPDRFGSYQDALLALPSILWLVQQRALPQWNRLGHTGVVALRTCRRNHCLTNEHFESGVCGQPRAFRQRRSRPSQTADRCVDQSTGTSRRPNEKRPPEIHCPEGPQEASLTHPRFGYPLAGCVPAEPASVSPNETNLPHNKFFEHPSHA